MYDLVKLLSDTEETEDSEDTEDTEDRANYDDGLKAKCAAGTFYNSTSKKCEACSPGFFRFTIYYFSIFILIVKFLVTFTLGKHIRYILTIS